MLSEVLPSWDPSQIPTPHQLTAAARVAQTLTFDGAALDAVRAGYPHLPSDGLFSLADFRLGEEILVAAEIAVRMDDRIKIRRMFPWADRREEGLELILIALLETQPPAWLGAATRGGQVRRHFIPDDARHNLRSIISDPERRDAMLLRLGHQFDDRRRRELGAAGEAHVVEACRRVLREAGRPELIDDVLQVSQISDLLGYDVRSPTTWGGILRFEVKTVGSTSGPLVIHLSRNEFDTGLGDASWCLVVCRRIGKDTFEVVGWCGAASLLAQVPADPEALGSRWTGVQIQLPDDLLLPGLPALAKPAAP